jgi:hypothetical protein
VIELRVIRVIRGLLFGDLLLGESGEVQLPAPVFLPPVLPSPNT